MTSLKFAKKEAIVHIIVWIAICGFVIFQSVTQLHFLPRNSLLRLALAITLFYFNYFLLVPRLLLKNKMGTYFIVAFITMTAAVFILNKFLFPEALFERLAYRFPRRRVILPDIGMLTLHFIAGAVIRIYKEWKKSEGLKEVVEKEKVMSELSFLKTQLSPHFLFNSLNTIYSLSEKKSADTSEAILNLSELMRYMLYEANSEKVALSKEINYLKNYVQLQLLRLSDSTNVFFNVKGDERNKEITPLIFISFIENAFKYGTDYKGQTHVRINLEVFEESICLVVSNKIGRKRKQIESSGIGLENIKNRLQLLYPDAHKLVIGEHGGLYRVDLKLNLI